MWFVRSSQDIPTKESLFIFLHLFILFWDYNNNILTSGQHWFSIYNEKIKCRVVSLLRLLYCNLLNSPLVACCSESFWNFRRIKEICSSDGVRYLDLWLVLNGNRRQRQQRKGAFAVLLYLDSKLGFHLNVAFFQKTLMHFKLMQPCMLLKLGIINYSLNHRVLGKQKASEWHSTWILIWFLWSLHWFWPVWLQQV